MWNMGTFNDPWQTMMNFPSGASESERPGLPALRRHRLSTAPRIRRLGPWLEALSKSTFEKTSMASMDWFKRKPIHKTHKTIVVVCKHAGWSCYFFPYTSSGKVGNGHPNNPRSALCTLWWAATSHCHQKSLKQLGSWLVDFETQRLQYLDKLCVWGWQKVIETYLSEGHS